MSDFLIVHEAGQSPWFWGKVWGNITSPSEHPPRLASPRYANQFYLLNLPGHGSDEEGDTADVRLDECVQAVVRAPERRGMRDLVLVGHGVGGMIALEAACTLPTPPKRLILVAGVVPDSNNSALSLIPSGLRKYFSRGGRWKNLVGNDSRLPASAVAKYFCNGMDLSEITKAVGFFGPLPTTLLATPVDLPLQEIPCPVSYLVLDGNRFLSPDLQLAMARKIPGANIAHLNSCHQAPLHKPIEVGNMLTLLSQ